MKMFIALILLALTAVGVYAWRRKAATVEPHEHWGRNASGPETAAERAYYAEQRKLFDAAKAELVKAGRMPADFGNDYAVLGQYGWHSSNDVKRRVVGAGGDASYAAFLMSDGGGSFGAYSFHPPAFEQAKRSWWIIGLMRKGSDLLVAVNRNAMFDDRTRGFTILGCFPEDMCAGKIKEQAERKNTMNSPVGFSVGYMYQGPEHARVVEVVDERTLRLDKKSPGDVLQYDLAILPPGHVDMCACTWPNNPPSENDKNCKPFVQGMTLGPGESACVSIAIGSEK